MNVKRLDISSAIILKEIRKHLNEEKYERKDRKRKRREKRIKRLKQRAERIEKFLSENEPKLGSRGKEMQSNVTNNDSAKLTSSHGVSSKLGTSIGLSVKYETDFSTIC